MGSAHDSVLRGRIRGVEQGERKSQCSAFLFNTWRYTINSGPSIIDLLMQFMAGKIDAVDARVRKRSERSVELELAHKVRSHAENAAATLVLDRTTLSGTD